MVFNHLSQDKKEEISNEANQEKKEENEEEDLENVQINKNQEDKHNPKKVYIKDKISKKILKWQPGYSIINIITKIINYEFKR